MATTVERTNIIKLVTAMFNAAPGANYLAEQTAFFDAAGGTSAQKLAALGTALGNTAAYVAANPSTQSASAFASAYLTPFGLQANQEAIDFITVRFNAGTPKGLIAYQATLALNSSTAPVFATARAILDNKTNVAEYFSVTKAVAQTDVAVLRTVLSTVTEVASTVPTAKSNIDGGTGYLAANVFALTAATNDASVGTTGSDLFQANTNAFLTTGDNVNGGAGIDTLTAAITAAGQTIAPTVTGVEFITLTITPTDDLSSTFDAANVTGATTVTVKNAGAVASVSAVPELVTISNLAKTVTLGIEGGTASTGNTASQIVATFAGILLTDTQKVAVSAAAKTAQLTLSGAETLEITAMDAGNAIGSLAAAVVRTLNIVGAGDLTIAVTDLASIVAVNASTATGAIAFTSETGSTLTYTGSIGADSVTGAGLADTISTGAGNDTVTGLAGADTINVGTGLDTLVVGTGDSGAFTAPTTNTISTASFDVITGMTVGDKIDLTNVVRTATSSNTLVGSAATDNTVVAVRGTYDAILKTFAGSATGVDTLVNYDTDISAAVSVQAIVLVGFVNTATATSDALGVFTLA